MNAKKKIKNLAIVVKPHIKDVHKILTSLVDWLQRRKTHVSVEDRFGEKVGKNLDMFPSRTPPRDVDLVVVIGGDGTFLSVVRSMGSHQLPILGINAGSLGFLTDIPLPNLYKALDSVLAGDYTIESRTRQDAELVRDDEVLAKQTILNDVVITKGAIARMIEVGVEINGQLVSIIRADGVIISTPTGSTAYSLSAGGPILYPGIGSIILTPICPHTLTYRPVVVSDSSHIELSLRSSSGEVYATFDGQTSVPLLQGDIVRAQKSRSSLRLVSLPGHNYFQVLRHKLRWAERPRTPDVAAGTIQKPNKR